LELVATPAVINATVYIFDLVDNRLLGEFSGEATAATGGTCAGATPPLTLILQSGGSPATAACSLGGHAVRVTASARSTVADFATTSSDETSDSTVEPTPYVVELVLTLPPDLDCLL
jgi:hypothetical protein